MDSSPYTKERKFHVVLDLETADNPVKIPPTSRKDHCLKFYVTTSLPSVGLHLSHESRNETCAWRVYRDSAGSPLAGGTVAASGHTRFMSPPRPPVHSVHSARLCAPCCPGPAPSGLLRLHAVAVPLPALDFPKATRRGSFLVSVECFPPFEILSQFDPELLPRWLFLLGPLSRILLVEDA